MMKVSLTLLALVSCVVSAPCLAQEVVAVNEPKVVVEATPKEASPPPEAKKDEEQGIALPNSDRLRVRVRFMSGYGLDESQSSLGFEKQGAVGYLIAEAYGKFGSRLSYRFEVNAVNDNQPGVSCGEKNFFFPNAAQPIGPNVVCDNNGRIAVDDYRFRGLDPLMQQKFVRQAYLQYNAGPFSARFGRFILPMGFGWEEMGSLTAKDAPHIQRINAEASFGFQVGLEKRLRGRQFATISFSGVTGDGNKFRDYDYFYGLDGSLDSNSWPTGVLAGSLQPVKGLDLRVALKKGDTGSKVERLPNFYASKRNDDAVILSARYQPHQDIAVFAEKANYTWGLMKTSAELLGLDQAPVKKDGYYVGADVSHAIARNVRVGTIVTREELSRDDALVKYMSELGLYRAALGKKERSTAVRVYADIAKAVRVGVYRNDLDNPFPQLSGIQPVAGENAFKGRGNDKWGVVVRLILQ